MKRRITRESTAWQFLADKLEAQGKMSPYTLLGDDVDERCNGLCAEISVLHDEDIIDFATRRAMEERISTTQMEKKAIDPTYWGWGYLWPELEVGPRIIAAQLFAILARQDERQKAAEHRAIRAEIVERIAA